MIDNNEANDNSSLYTWRTLLNVVHALLAMVLDSPPVSPHAISRRQRYPDDGLQTSQSQVLPLKTHEPAIFFTFLQD